MKHDERIRIAERRLFSGQPRGVNLDETYLDLPGSDVRLRVLSVGAGPAIVLLHGVGLSSVAWLPLVPELNGYRLHLVDLPGHGLSSPVDYRRSTVRGRTIQLFDELLDAMHLAGAPVIGHSLGGMFALWHASARPGRISSLVAIGDPAVALPGVSVRMPLSLMGLPILGPLMLRAPTPRAVYRYLLGQALSPAAATAASNALLDVLRLQSSRRENAYTIASLMHALNHFRRPRQASVMSDLELRRITLPTMFAWGEDDPFLRPAQARPSIAKMSSAILRELPGGHGPWLEDPTACATLIIDHFTKTGHPPALGGPP